MNDAQARFRYHDVWQTLDDSTRDEVASFWQRHGAILDEQRARKRVGQVVALARAAGGEIAGVCTAQKQRVPDLGETLYYYRTFVAPGFRNGFIVRRLLARAVGVLGEYSRRHPGDGAKGVYLELENPSFAKRLRWAVWPRPGLEFVYIGTTPQGLERRVLWFPHARISRPRRR